MRTLGVEGVRTLLDGCACLSASMSLLKLHGASCVEPIWPVWSWVATRSLETLSFHDMVVVCAINMALLVGLAWIPGLAGLVGSACWLSWLAGRPTESVDFLSAC